jgi:hypothetical protein
MLEDDSFFTASYCATQIKMKQDVSVSLGSSIASLLVLPLGQSEKLWFRSKLSLGLGVQLRISS